MAAGPNERDILGDHCLFWQNETWLASVLFWSTTRAAVSAREVNTPEWMRSRCALCALYTSVLTYIAGTVPVLTLTLIHPPIQLNPVNHFSLFLTAMAQVVWVLVGRNRD
jgi:hypothetical protein|tara:strand:- start:2767 stop:3096 length:330 start_codon:yes stop_codon:yes gene_type:complete